MAFFMLCSRGPGLLPRREFVRIGDNEDVGVIDDLSAVHLSLAYDSCNLRVIEIEYFMKQEDGAAVACAIRVTFVRSRCCTNFRS